MLYLLNFLVGWNFSTCFSTISKIRVDICRSDDLENLLMNALLRYRKCPRLGLDFPSFEHTDGLDASSDFISAAGTLFPMALCGLSSL
jgi:hypothetical protein